MEGIQERGHGRAGMKTMLDALLPVLHFLETPDSLALPPKLLLVKLATLAEQGPPSPHLSPNLLRSTKPRTLSLCPGFNPSRNYHTTHHKSVTAHGGAPALPSPVSLCHLLPLGAEATSLMESGAGRSLYVPSKGLGWADPGATAIALIFRALCQALSE